MSDAPFLVPRETPTGVRFVPPPNTTYVQGAGSTLVPTFLAVMAVLLSAGPVGGYILVIAWPNLPDWARAVGPLYVVQIALDAGLVGRSLWRMERYCVGRFEMEVAGDRLRAGRRWGRVWVDAPMVSVPGLQRLVIVRRPCEVIEGKSGTNWDLVAEPGDGPPVTLLSVYDEPDTVRAVGRELHARLSAGPEVARPLPPLTEEDGQAEAVPAPRPLVPGGAWTWLVIHGVGTVGLWPILGAAWGPGAEGAFLRAAGTAMALLQGVIVVTNLAGLQALRRRARRPS